MPATSKKNHTKTHTGMKNQGTLGYDKKRTAKMSAQFAKNYNDLSATLSENYVISKLAGEDYAYAFGVLMDLSCTKIGERTGVTAPTVTRKINKLCEKLGVGNKKELKAYLQKYL